MADVQMTRVIAGSQLESVGVNDAGKVEYVVHLANPLDQSYLGLPPKGTVLPDDQGADVVLSVDSFGTPKGRPSHARGTDERCTKDGMMLVFRANGPHRFLLPFAE